MDSQTRILGLVRSPDKKTPAEDLPGRPAKIELKSPRPALIRIWEPAFEIFCPDTTHPFPGRPILGLPGVLTSGCGSRGVKKEP